jgi:hypothetical protein
VGSHQEKLVGKVERNERSSKQLQIGYFRRNPRVGKHEGEEIGNFLAECGRKIFLTQKSGQHHVGFLGVEEEISIGLQCGLGAVDGGNALVNNSAVRSTDRCDVPHGGIFLGGLIFPKRANLQAMIFRGFFVIVTFLVLVAVALPEIVGSCIFKRQSLQKLAKVTYGAFHKLMPVQMSLNGR